MGHCDLGTRCPNRRYLSDLGEVEYKLEEAIEANQKLTAEINSIKASPLKSVLSKVNVIAQKPMGISLSTQTYLSYHKSKNARLKLFVLRFWLVRYERAIQKLLSIRLRAAAEPKSNIGRKEPPADRHPSSASQNKTPFSTLQRAILDSEIDVINKKLKSFESDLLKIGVKARDSDEVSKIALKEVGSVRNETNVLAREFKTAMKEIKISINSNQVALADLRQKRHDFLNSPGTVEKSKATVSKIVSADKSMEEEKAKNADKDYSEKLKKVADEFFEGIKGVRGEVETIRKMAETKVENTGVEVVKEMFERVLDDFQTHKLEVSNRSEKMRQAFEDLNNQVSQKLTYIQNASYNLENSAEVGKQLTLFKGKMHEYDSTLESLKDTLAESKSLIGEYRSITNEHVRTFAKEKMQQASADRIAYEKERQKGRSKAGAKRSVDRMRVQEAEEEIKKEITASLPKIVNFAREWKSLTNGDFIKYKGVLLEITDEFNPSQRVKHNGQNGDKWELQKFANLYWFERGMV